MTWAVCTQASLLLAALWLLCIYLCIYLFIYVLLNYKQCLQPWLCGVHTDWLTGRQADDQSETRLSLSSRSGAWLLWQNVPANAGHQYCKAAVLRDMIKGTLRIFPTSPWDRFLKSTKDKMSVKVVRTPTKVQADVLTIWRWLRNGSSIISTWQILLWWPNRGICDRWSMWHTWVIKNVLIYIYIYIYIQCSE
jgi:hypothetical protein